MPRAIPLSVRQVLIERHRHGESLRALAHEFHLSRWTVRAFWRHYQQAGSRGLAVRYDRCAGRSLQSPRLVHYAACTLKRNHPAWGAGLIRYLLQQRWPHQAVPTVRTLQRWFRQAHLHTPRRRLPSAPHIPGGRPHAVWQMDAIEQLRLADGSYACWLTITDEASGAILAAEVFPPALLGQCEPAGGAGHLAPDFRRLGPAPAVAGGQRHPVGHGG